MKHLFFLLSFTILFSSCTNTKIYRTNFSEQEKEILTTSRKIITDSYFGTLITVDKKGQPRARVMEVFAPEADFTIWMATNPKSRKVVQIENNPQTTLHYFDKNAMGYVSLMGKAFIVNDNAIKATKWKAGWDKFYQNQEEAYLLIKFIPESLELISIPNGFTGDEKTWQPHKVILKK